MEKAHLRPAASAFLLMVTMSLLSTALSFFVEPVCAEMGFGRGTFTLYYSLMTAAGAVSVSFLGQYMNKHGVRNIILISALWCGAGFWGLSLARSLWVFYLVGAVMGLFGTSCVYLCANITVQQSYSSRDASMVMGVVMAGAGIGGVIWSNAVPKLLSTFGWQFSYRMLGIFWLVLALLSWLILGKQNLAGGIGKTGTALGGVSKKEAMASLRFYLVVALMCILTICSCISQQLPSLLSGMGHSASQVGTLISVMTAASAIGTVMEGLLCGKFGVFKTMLVVLVLYILGFGLLFIKDLTYLALIGLALGSGSIGTLMPVVVRQVFGGRDYAAIWSLVITTSSITSFAATPVWGMIYDLFGTYTPAIITMPILLVLSIGLMVKIFHKRPY